MVFFTLKYVGISGVFTASAPDGFTDGSIAARASKEEEEYMVSGKPLKALQPFFGDDEDPALHTDQSLEDEVHSKKVSVDK